MNIANAFPLVKYEKIKARGNWGKGGVSYMDADIVKIIQKRG